MGSLVNDISLRLDEEQQRLLARWATKTAMVIESVKQEKNNFDRLNSETRFGLRSFLQRKLPSGWGDALRAISSTAKRES